MKTRASNTPHAAEEVRSQLLTLAVNSFAGESVSTEEIIARTDAFSDFIFAFPSLDIQDAGGNIKPIR